MPEKKKDTIPKTIRLRDSVRGTLMYSTFAVFKALWPSVCTGEWFQLQLPWQQCLFTYLAASVLFLELRVTPWTCWPPPAASVHMSWGGSRPLPTTNGHTVLPQSTFIHRHTDSIIIIIIMTCSYPQNDLFCICSSVTIVWFRDICQHYHESFG